MQFHLTTWWATCMSRNKELRVLNLYAGIGGNRLYWDDVEDIEVTAVDTIAVSQ